MIYIIAAIAILCSWYVIRLVKEDSEHDERMREELFNKFNDLYEEGEK